MAATQLPCDCWKKYGVENVFVYWAFLIHHILLLTSPLPFPSPAWNFAKARGWNRIGEKGFGCRTLKCQGGSEWMGSGFCSPQRPQNRFPEPGAGILFSWGLLGPDRTLRDSCSKTLDSGESHGPRLTHRPCLGEQLVVFSAITYAPTQSSAPLPSEVKGTLAMGQVDGMQPAAHQVLIENLGLQETGARASGCKVKGAPGLCPCLSLCSGARPAPAGRTCGAPRGALPQRLQPPPRLCEPRGGQPGVGEQRWAATRTASARWTVTTGLRAAASLALNRFPRFSSRGCWWI